MKDFKQDFFNLIEKLKKGENFSFIRFSDGELFVLQNKELSLGPTGTFVDKVLCGPKYAEEDYKEFIPEKHQFFREKLLESIKHKQENYYVGISCKCCVGQHNNQYMLDLIGDDNEFGTWSNLFVNSNYPYFVKHFLPALKGKNIVFMCNEKSNLSKLPVNVVKDFRIGRNAMINNFEIHKEIQSYIDENEIKDHVFLFSASSLTNITAYELFKRNPNNTFIDIGTTMNIFMGLSIERSYLNAYWKKMSHPDLLKVCVW